MRLSKIKRTKIKRKKMSNGQIVGIFNMLDDGDISTETLLAMTADKCHCSVDRVVSALQEDVERVNIRQCIVRIK